MTNEELDNAREIEAIRIYDLEQHNPKGHGVARIAARLAREGWTPPEPVDPDLAEAEKIWRRYRNNPLQSADEALFEAIKRGRELEREAKPGMVWKEHDGSDVCPVSVAEEVLIQYNGGQRSHKVMASMISWENVTHYAIITQPEDAA